MMGAGRRNDAAQMKLNFFDPKDYRIIVLKSTNNFRAWWTDVASPIIDCNPPGIASNDLFTFEYKNKKQKRSLSLILLNDQKGNEKYP